MDDGVGLINMNARMYDAKLGRFLQPDSYIQFPETTQGFNRYSYVENNPLSYTDPTGNFLDEGEREVQFSDRDDFESIARDIEREEGNEPENTDSDPGLRGVSESSKGDASRAAGTPRPTYTEFMTGPPRPTYTEFMTGPDSPYSNRAGGDQGLRPVAIVSGPIVIGLAVRVLWGLATAGTAAAGYDVVETTRRRAADRALNARSGFRSSDDSGSTGSDSKTTPDDANNGNSTDTNEAESNTPTEEEIEKDSVKALEEILGRPATKKEQENFDQKHGISEQRNKSRKRRSNSREAGNVGGGKEHTSNKRKSNEGQHQGAESRRARDQRRRERRLR